MINGCMSIDYCVYDHWLYINTDCNIDELISEICCLWSCSVYHCLFTTTFSIELNSFCWSKCLCCDMFLRKLMVSSIVNNFKSNSKNLNIPITTLRGYNSPSNKNWSHICWLNWTSKVLAYYNINSDTLQTDLRTSLLRIVPTWYPAVEISNGCWELAIASVHLLFLVSTWSCWHLLWWTAESAGCGSDWWNIWSWIVRPSLSIVRWLFCSGLSSSRYQGDGL